MLWHEHLRRLGKLTVVGSLHYSGILSLVRRLHMRNRAVILLYHRVSPLGQGVPDYSPNGMTVTPDEFEMQMRFICENFEVTSLAHIVDALNCGLPFPSRLCCVTFDDGWRDVYDHAFPILKSQGIPATVFLTTGLLRGAKWSWEEQARFMLANIYKHRDRVLSEPVFHTDRLRLGDMSLSLFLQSHPSHMARKISLAIKKYQGLSCSVREAVLQDLGKLSNLLDANAGEAFLTWDQVRVMARYAIEFGNHTVTHPVLPELSDEEIVREVDGASKELAEGVGYTSRYFAYPYGKYNECVAQTVRSCRMDAACTTRIGLVSRGDDPYALNRMHISSEVSSYKALFAARVMGL